MRSTQRLDKILVNLGYGTRKEIKKYTKNGLISVDGRIIQDSSMHVDPHVSVIEVDGEKLNYREMVYLMMNKPDGVISATWDNHSRTVIDLLSEEYRVFEPFPVGRLDKDTEGLLLLTNDGQLAHDLLSPKKHVPKKYYALIHGRVGEEDIKAFEAGIMLDDGYVTLPARLDILKAGERSEIEVVIHEGKYHQVKRMFEAVGKQVMYLRRLEMGSLKLDEALKPGECRELTEDEVAALKVLNK